MEPKLADMGMLELISLSFLVWLFRGEVGKKLGTI